MLKWFNSLWSTVPTCWNDTETTGTHPGRDRVVSVACVRFENQKPVARLSSLIDPGIPIPAEATAVHGITNDQVKGAPRLDQFFARQDVRELLRDAQPGAFNQSFDKKFLEQYLDDWTWPWLDSLSFVRKFDRYLSGKGRHKLELTCKRYGIVLERAHTAEADAEAAGRLFYVLGERIFPKVGDKGFPNGYSLGQALGWQMRIDCAEWLRFNQWRADNPVK